MRGRTADSKKLAAMIRGRARSRWLIGAGWLAERLGGRASRIMGIEGGLSNNNFAWTFIAVGWIVMTVWHGKTR